MGVVLTSVRRLHAPFPGPADLRRSVRIANDAEVSQLHSGCDCIDRTRYRSEYGDFHACGCRAAEDPAGEEPPRVEPRSAASGPSRELMVIPRLRLRSGWQFGFFRIRCIQRTKPGKFVRGRK